MRVYARRRADVTRRTGQSTETQRGDSDLGVVIWCVRISAQSVRRHHQMALPAVGFTGDACALHSQRIPIQWLAQVSNIVARTTSCAPSLWFVAVGGRGEEHEHATCAGGLRGAGLSSHLYGLQ